MYDVQTVINETEELSMAEKRRPWSDLPSELLSQISDRLGLIDLLRFRSVCKHWNFSSSTSTAAPESSPGRSPWFLVYGYGDGSSCRWTGDSGEKFAVHLPDLDGGATCLASNHGWLLVLQSQSGSIFFLCPFSKARINLPNLDKSELSGSDGLVAAFSAPPPSRDCAVAVVGRKSVLRLGLSLIRRGEELWSAFEFNVTLPKTVYCGVFCDGSFYFFDRDDGLAIFSLEDRKLKTYRLVSGNEAKDVKDSLPFICRRYHLNDTNKFAEVPFDASISTCGTYVVESNGLDYVVFNEDFEVIGEEESSTRRLKGVWMHPRFFAKYKDDITW
ncbi:hypothetical protein TIFTF001_007391 [Ficus carica]|uniref:F-box domain-containing protein n=1 Tax=Ficus carica TaxID=3494 RepID=A0AA88A6H7_FICCA|nr:hypothetical protein TIFTF001_007391 [Ficus carica]